MQMINFDIFCDTYIWKKDARHCFLLLCHESKECPESYVNKMQRKPGRFGIGGVDGIKYYMLPISIAFEKTLRDQKGIKAFYNTLKAKLTDEGIKNLYPDIWLQKFNHDRRKQNLTEFYQRKHLRNIGALPPKSDGYIKHITQGVSKREAASWGV